MRLKLLAMLCFLSILSCATALSKKAPKPETCEPDFRNNAFQCVGVYGTRTRPFDALIDNDYSLINTKELGDYMGTCR